NMFMVSSSTEWVVLDLMDNAPGGRTGLYGHSYEVLGEVRTVNKVTQSFCESYALKYNTANLGMKPGASRFWLYHDCDDAGKNNVWDEPDNHGAWGGNVTYCDGHAKWVPNKYHDEEWKITRDSN